MRNCVITGKMVMNTIQLAVFRNGELNRSNLCQCTCSYGPGKHLSAGSVEQELLCPPLVENVLLFFELSISISTAMSKYSLTSKSPEFKLYEKNV